MDFLVNGIQAVANFLWGTPMTIALLGIGIYMTIKFKFKYQFSLKFMFQNSIGKLFKKGEKGEGTISSFAAGCTALASTVGVGNIAGRRDGGHDGRPWRHRLDVGRRTGGHVHQGGRDHPRAALPRPV